MKTLRFVIAPTRNRRLNELLGLLMLVAAALLLLSIVSYRATDPSLNTAAGFSGHRAVHNWAGLVGATISDLLLQVEGATALWLPVLLGMLGFSWMRSRPAGSPGAKLAGAVLILLFGPAIFALIPGHLHWMHGLPAEGLTGRLVADLLVEYQTSPAPALLPEPWSPPRSISLQPLASTPRRSGFRCGSPLCRLGAIGGRTGRLPGPGSESYGRQ